MSPDPFRMKYPAQCRFCKKPLLVTVDESYNAHADPHKLFPMAACNTCADLRSRRRWLEDAIEKAVHPLLVSHGTKRPMQSQDIDKLKAALTTLTKRYTELIATWHKSTLPWWDSAIVENILEKPNHWNKFLAQCWKMYEPKATQAPRTLIPD